MIPEDRLRDIAQRHAFLEAKLQELASGAEPAKPAGPTRNRKPAETGGE